MQKVFWEDPYQQTLTTQVEQVEGNQVLFAQTIAYSFSGLPTRKPTDLSPTPFPPLQMGKDEKIVLSTLYKFSCACP